MLKNSLSEATMLTHTRGKSIAAVCSNFRLQLELQLLRHRITAVFNC